MHVTKTVFLIGCFKKQPIKRSQRLYNNNEAIVCCKSFKTFKGAIYLPYQGKRKTTEMVSLEYFLWSVIFGGIGGILTVLALTILEEVREGRCAVNENRGPRSAASGFQEFLKLPQEHDERSC